MLQVGLGHVLRGDREEPLLLQRPGDELGDLVLDVAELGNSARCPDVAHQLAQELGQRVRPGVGQRPAGEQLGDVMVAVGHRVVGEAERAGAVTITE